MSHSFKFLTSIWRQDYYICQFCRKCVTTDEMKTDETECRNNMLDSKCKGDNNELRRQLGGGDVENDIVR